MNHYVYEITNNLNGMKYIGKRSCYCPISEDKYMGSGVGIKDAIYEYGIENFTKIILSTHSSESEAYKEEARIIEKLDACNSEFYYNRAKGVYNKKIADNTSDFKKTISKHFTVHSEKDADIIDYIKDNPNLSKYIKDLIRADMEKSNEANKNKRSEIRKEVDQYARTKMFREVIIEGLKDFETMRFFEDYIEQKIEKNFEKYVDNRVKKALEKRDKKS